MAFCLNVSRLITQEKVRNWRPGGYVTETDPQFMRARHFEILRGIRGRNIIEWIRANALQQRENATVGQCSDATAIAITCILPPTCRLGSISTIALADQMGAIPDHIDQKGTRMADSKPKEMEILKLRQFVEKMGSVEKAKAAIETLQKIRKAA